MTPCAQRTTPFPAAAREKRWRSRSTLRGGNPFGEREVGRVWPRTSLREWLPAATWQQTTDLTWMSQRMAASGDVAANDGLDVDVESENELSIASTTSRDASPNPLQQRANQVQKKKPGCPTGEARTPASGR